MDFYSAGDTPSHWELNIWYHSLNCGYKVRLSGERAVSECHLTLFSRLGPYDTDLLWNAFEEKRELFEYWGHAASFLPVETFPLFRYRMETMAEQVEVVYKRAVGRA